jgi:hypothetical protein
LPSGFRSKRWRGRRVGGGSSLAELNTTKCCRSINDLWSSAGCCDRGHAGKLEAAYGTYRDAEDANVTMSEAITTVPGPG